MDDVTRTQFGRAGRGGLLLSAAPLAAAIATFGVIFGASASAQMDVALVVGMSVLVFSGTLQFATLGLLASGGGALAVIVTAIALNTRHVVLGLILKPHVHGSRLRRAITAWFLIDESFGLALTARQRAGFVVVVAGAIFYAAWLAGTVLGVLGARLVSLEGLAAAVFPVLFIGLAALTSRTLADAVRATVAGVLVTAMSLVPPLYPFAAIIAALVVAIPTVRR
jgi:predicted branched-subunit amino acid permease